MSEIQLPIQPVEDPILCSPYKESYQRPMIGKCAELMGVLGIKDS